MKAHYDLMVRGIEEKAEQAMGAQVLDKSSPYCGAVVQPDGVFQAKSTMYAVASLVTAYCNPDSRFYQNETVLSRAELGFDYVDRVQHENGLFDYVTCNFFSAPDTAFCILAWVPHLKYLMGKEGPDPGRGENQNPHGPYRPPGRQGTASGGLSHPQPPLGHCLPA